MKHLIGFFSDYKLELKSNGYHRFVNPLDVTRNKNAVVNFEHDYVYDHKIGYKSNIAYFVHNVTGWELDKCYEFVGKIEHKITPNISETVYEPTFLSTYREILPNEYLPLDYKSFIGQRCRDYWTSRNMNITQLTNKGWGFCETGKYKGRTIIPYKVQGKLVYFTARDFLGSPQRYLFPPTSETKVGKSELVYNQDALFKYNKGFMVEGAVDSECVGDNCIAIGGWKLSDTQISIIRNSRWTELHIIPDKGFELKAQATGYYFKDIMDVYIHKIPDFGKDVNDVGFNNIIFSKKKL